MLEEIRCVFVVILNVCNFCFIVLNEVSREAIRTKFLYGVPVWSNPFPKEFVTELYSFLMVFYAPLTGTCGRCQISSLYSRIVRSVENRPLQAVLRILINVHLSLS